MTTQCIDDVWQLRVLLRRISGNPAQIAERLGISERSMRRYRRGEWPVPRAVWLALEWLAELDRQKTVEIPGLFPVQHHRSPTVSRNRPTRIIE